MLRTVSHVLEAEGEAEGGGEAEVDGGGDAEGGGEGEDEGGGDDTDVAGGGTGGALGHVSVLTVLHLPFVTPQRATAPAAYVP